MTTHPADRLLPCAHGAGLDRLPVEEAAQVVGQLQGGSVALTRLLAHALLADDFQVARDFLAERAQRGRVLLEDLGGSIAQGRLAGRRAARGKRGEADAAGE